MSAGATPGGLKAGIITRQEIAMKKTVWLPILLAFAALTAGCNTMRGAGQDIERGGEKIQQKAQ